MSRAEAALRGGGSRVLLVALGVLLAGCAAQPPRLAGEPAPAPHACPSGVPAGTRCLAGRDSAGAHYLIALPPRWQGDLVVHAHGGPTLGAPALERVEEDLQRWSLVLRAGYAWAGSSFHQGGVAVQSAADDTNRLRGLFAAHVARPRLTLLHGQSWGASVAAVAASRPEARDAYDGVLLTSGVLAGGPASYTFRLDLRAIDQAVCGNHPRADEPAYPLWQGLAAGSTMTAGDLRRRVDECLALDRPEARRSPDQQRKVRAIAETLRIPASSIHGHLAWATFHFRDIADRLQGLGSPFDNVRAVYRGTSDDATLNRTVARVAADPRAVARFGADTTPDGRIAVPVLTLHGRDDPTAFVELEDSFRRILEQAGTSDHLVQVFTSDATHSYLTDAAYLTALEVLARWARGGTAPTPASIAARCIETQEAAGCRFLPGFRPPALATRVTPRE